jgi:hypothetical protein
MPHLPVLREDSATTKLSVVFDASAKTDTNLSLIDVVMVGPTIQDSLFSILTRFITHRYALIADIEKMYRQISIDKSQWDLQRIFWRESRDQLLQIYRLKTVTYGTACAPYLATRTLTQLAIDKQKMYAIASHIATRDFYMDDLLTGANTIEEAKQLQSEIDKLMKSGGFHLRKWSSNSEDVLAGVTPLTER